MIFDFDRVVDRTGTDAAKYAGLQKDYGRADVIPLSVADMDFPVFPPILEAMRVRMDQQIFGYHTLEEPAKHAVCRWYAARHGLQVSPEQIQLTTNVVSGFSLAVQALSKPEDAVVIQPPVYGPFYLGSHHRRRIIQSPLKMHRGRWEMDLEDMEEHFREGARVLILCNPHNPVGRSWSMKELTELSCLCERYDVTVLSDEIHGDLTLPGHQHTPILSVPGMAERSILFSSASKTFNLAGLSTAFAIVPDAGIRRKYMDILDVVGAGNNLFGLTAMIAAFDKCRPFLDEQMAYLNANLSLAAGRIRDMGLVTWMPEATYLLFIDCGASVVGKDPLTIFGRAGVGLTRGSFFGKDYATYVRLNAALPRQILCEALDRMQQALE